MSNAVSIPGAYAATQMPSQGSPYQGAQGEAQGRQEGAANFSEFIATKVSTIARLLSNWAPRGFCSRIATLMGWRAERRSREISGVERLSLDTVLAELHVHAQEGRQDAVDQMVAALLEGLRTASVPVRPDSLIELYGIGGQRFLRFTR